MRKIMFTFLGLIFSLSVLGQTYNTGDKTLDSNLKSITLEANKDLTTFKANVVTTYGTTLANVNSLFTAGMTAGDVVMSFEIMKLTKKPVADVIAVYKKSKSKGWGEMAKEMGIKPGSAEFHALKDSAGKNKAKVTKGKSASAQSKKPASSDSKSKGNGNGNGKKK